jgi:hypothetical protein
MSATIRKNDAAPDTWTTVHPLSPEDSTAITALRRMVASMKGKLEGSTARGPFNAIIERVAAPQGVTFEADTVGGISGWWARAADGKKGAAVLHLHGGWFNWGTAQAYRNLVGHIVSSAGADAFVPDYRARESFWLAFCNREHTTKEQSLSIASSLSTLSTPPSSTFRVRRPYRSADVGALPLPQVGRCSVEDLAD